MRFENIASLMLAATLATGATASVFSEGFESYADNAAMHGVNGWKGWDNNPAFGASTSSLVARTGSQSVHVTGAADLVHTYAGVSSGAWSFSAYQWIDPGATGVSYFILMNKYADGGNTNWQSWSVQMKFDLNSGKVFDDLRGTSTARDIARGRWAEIRVDFDLTNNTLQEWYDGALVFSGAWTQGGASALSLAAVDLYAGTGRAYYDDISLDSVPAPGAAALAGLGLLVSARRSGRG